VAYDSSFCVLPFPSWLRLGRTGTSCAFCGRLPLGCG
jgi:hypothetical protein